MVSIVGWGHTKFGRAEEDLEGLIAAAGREALSHAGIGADRVGGIWVGHFNAGMVGDGFPSSLAFAADLKLRYTPATRIENACASGSAAIFAACDAIRSGRIDVALVIGAEKMTHLSTADVSTALSHASYQKEEAGLTFPAVFAKFAAAYGQAYGDPSLALAEIAVKNHANAMHNPLAHLHKPLDLEFCLTPSEKNPVVAAPLKVTDCSLISDGAAAVVLASPEAAAAFPRSVRMRGASHVSDLLPMSARKLTALDGAARAMTRALNDAGLRIDDIGVAEVHDCFTIAELLIYEAMGLAGPGEGRRALDEGTVRPGGRLPVNLSGGLKAKGHPVGASGISMHVMVARQVLGEAGDMQADGVSTGLVFNMGGSSVANYCSVLEAGH